MKNNDLNKQERLLFETYNWRAPNKVKIDHLKRLISVIEQIENVEHNLHKKRSSSVEK